MVIIGVLIIQNNVIYYYTMGNLPYISRGRVYIYVSTGATGFNRVIILTNIGNQRLVDVTTCVHEQKIKIFSYSIYILYRLSHRDKIIYK